MIVAMKDDRDDLITSVQLQNLYVKQGLSQATIGQRLGVAQGTVGTYLKRFGIAARPIQKKSAVTAEELRDLYVTQGLTQDAIGKKLGICQGVVGDYLKEFGIETRRVGVVQQVIIPEEELRRLYREERLTFSQLAAHFGCGKGTIHHAIRDYGIRMDFSEKKENQSSRNKKRFTYTSSHKGYLMIFTPGHPNATKFGYVGKHRLVAEEAIGRYLEPGEQVHHINLRIRDNEIENLAVIATFGDHMRVHHYMQRVGAFLAGLRNSHRPEPLDFGMPVFWGGKYVPSIDLTQGREPLIQPPFEPSVSAEKETVN